MPELRPVRVRTRGGVVEIGLQVRRGLRRPMGLAQRAPHAALTPGSEETSCFVGKLPDIIKEAQYAVVASIMGVVKVWQGIERILPYL